MFECDRFKAVTSLFVGIRRIESIFRTFVFITLFNSYSSIIIKTLEMSCAHCKRTNFELISLKKNIVLAKFIMKKYKNLELSDKICSRCFTSSENARKRRNDIVAKKLTNSEPSLNSVATNAPGSLISNNSVGENISLDEIDNMVYKTPQLKENQLNAKSINEDPEIGGSISVRLYKAYKRSKIFDESIKPTAPKALIERQRVLARINNFVPSDNEVQSISQDDSINSISMINKTDSIHLSNKSKSPDSTEDNIVSDPESESESSTNIKKKVYKIFKPMPKCVKLKKMMELQKKSGDNFLTEQPSKKDKNQNIHSSQEAGPSGVNKKISDPLSIVDDSEYSDDSFPDIQSLEPPDSLVHTRPIIPRRKQKIVFSNKDQMDIYLQRNNFGG